MSQTLSFCCNAWRLIQEFHFWCAKSNKPLMMNNLHHYYIRMLDNTGLQLNQYGASLNFQSCRQRIWRILPFKAAIRKNIKFLWMMFNLSWYSVRASLKSHVITEVSVLMEKRRGLCWFRAFRGILMCVFASSEQPLHSLLPKVNTFTWPDMELNKYLQETISNASIVKSIVMLVIITLGRWSFLIDAL